MINPDHYVDSLNQLLNKIDKTAENSCLNHPGSIELTDFLRKLIEMDSAEAVKHLIIVEPQIVIDDENIDALINTLFQHRFIPRQPSSITH